MEIVHHGGRCEHEFLPESLSRLIDLFPQFQVQPLGRAAFFDALGVIQADLGNLHSREAPGQQVQFLLLPAERVPLRRPDRARGNRGVSGHLRDSLDPDQPGRRQLGGKRRRHQRFGHRGADFGQRLKRRRIGGVGARRVQHSGDFAVHQHRIQVDFLSVGVAEDAHQVRRHFRFTGNRDHRFFSLDAVLERRAISHLQAHRLEDLPRRLRLDAA